VTSKDIVKQCLSQLTDNHIRCLMRHVDKDTPILCGNEQCCDYFIYKGVCDPVILACYEKSYSTGNVQFMDIHPAVQDVYKKVAQCVPHSGYVNNLQMLSQLDVRIIIQAIAKDRGINEN